jgi:hypothetical protein
MLPQGRSRAEGVIQDLSEGDFTCTKVARRSYLWPRWSTSAVLTKNNRAEECPWLDKRTIGMVLAIDYTVCDTS